MPDPVTRLVEAIAAQVVREGEVQEVYETAEGDMLQIHVRLTTHGANGAFIGRGGEVIGAVALLAKHAARGRWRDVRVVIERDHLEARGNGGRHLKEEGRR